MGSEFGDLAIATALVIIHSIGLVAAAHAALRSRTSQGAIAWAVSLTFMPYLTLIPYLIFGRSEFVGYVDARRTRNRQLHRLTQHIDLTETISAPDGEVGAPQFSATPTLTRLTHLPLTPGNDARLLVNGKETFAAILALIPEAKHYVVVQFFIVHDDDIGNRLKDALLDKAAEGVPVYFLYDGIGSHDLPARYPEQLKAGGVHVREFRTQRGVVNRFQLNFRNHRKIVIVDGERLFLGGHNVGDEYLGYKPPLSPWRDTHVEIAGPAVAAAQLMFVEDWYWAAKSVPKLRWEPAHHERNMYCQIIPSGPADEQDTCSLFFVEAINTARTRVWIASPYLVPDEAVFTALKLAVLRGVDVRLLLPSRPDHYIVFQASSFYAYEAVRAGMHVYRYQPGFMHQKVVLIDDEAAAVGSANLDNRSFRLNFEIMALLVDSEFCSSTEAMLLEDFKKSKPVQRAEYERASLWRRLLMRVARLFAPIL